MVTIGKSESDSSIEDRRIPERQLKNIREDDSQLVVPGEMIRETREIKRVLIRQLTKMRQRIHIGPLPPAIDFKKYNDVLNGAADRILKMAESEQTHGQEMDRETLRLDREIASRGQHYALITTILLGAMGLGLGLTGHDLLGGTFVVSACVPIVAHFLTAKGGREKNAVTAEPKQLNPAKSLIPSISSEAPDQHDSATVETDT